MEGNRDRRFQGASPELQTTAWQLRDAMTPAEQVLWEALRDRRLNGLKFRRQHPVEQFILDFYCPQHRLVVELDGGIHEIQREQDAVRTAYLEARGYYVIRFRNDEAFANLPSVLERIMLAANRTSDRPPQPPIMGEHENTGEASQLKSGSPIIGG